ncbi:putative bifunctional diguanylate cyclase/phosphodiesterase [Variibacter gotjawalensis]|uniref:putative bifunctional diguanylate cyclase/phosphodiesterase n=1 Tax=Variibacter gotjawalensis TaxID=1333996 RepID=UPI0018D4ED1B|nr:EAL domain-containing protein [Variibacter gotjawalensis]NIK49834.1 diguanylate cyclase (GGDEF)-like protein [Variibacter gotjawalensis]
MSQLNASGAAILRVISCLVTQHNLWLVALAASMCCLGSAITFGLFARARERSGLEKCGWTFLTAVAAGSSIWCTHFIAMLGYNIDAPVSLDPIYTTFSLLVAIVGCGVGFSIGAFSRQRFAPELSGCILGVSVSVMHYTGMQAYRVTGVVEWHHNYVVCSILLASLFSALAMREAKRLSNQYAQLAAAALFVFAIVSLHFTGMAAVEVTPLADFDNRNNREAFTAVAVAVASVGLIVAGTGVASYLIDNRASAQTVGRLRRLALHDALTGLPNRVHFSDHLSAELNLAERKAHGLAVIVIDLNNFKEVNDLRGHGAGDHTLQVIGQRFADLTGLGEFVARVGGDEFAATTRYEEIAEVNAFVDRLNAALNQPLAFDGFEAATGGAFGIALYGQDGLDAEQLVSNADLAMYRAKNRSGVTACFYRKEMDEAARERKSIRADLQYAIARGELKLHYQVQTSALTDEVTGYEALLRWTHRTRGLIPPDIFIPIAEESGAIVEIGDWVLRTACKTAVQWGRDKIAVNVSGVQIARADFAESVHSILYETGLPPNRLELEITETALIADKVRALHTIRQIHALGVSIAIDDFGTGYSSMQTLRTFPFSKIKLDRSFTHGLDREPAAKAILHAVLALGKSLGITVLAEGVETLAQLDILRHEGCDEVQGYLLGRPEPRESALAANISVAQLSRLAGAA